MYEQNLSNQNKSSLLKKNIYTLYWITFKRDIISALGFFKYNNVRTYNQRDNFGLLKTHEKGPTYMWDKYECLKPSMQLSLLEKTIYNSCNMISCSIYEYYERNNEFLIQGFIINFLNFSVTNPEYRARNHERDNIITIN